MLARTGLPTMHGSINRTSSTRRKGPARKKTISVGGASHSVSATHDSNHTDACTGAASEDRGRGSRGAGRGGGGEGCAARHGCSAARTSMLLLHPSRRWIRARRRTMTRLSRSTTAMGRLMQLASSVTTTAAMPTDAGCGLPLGSSGLGFDVMWVGGAGSPAG
jgi:hypothetical protein